MKAVATTPAKQLLQSGRRPRIPLSCDSCRSRKLKCNREQPCQNCSARAEHANCKFKGSPYRPGSAASPRHEHDADAMQQRIVRLENLVKTLVAQDQAIPHLEDSSQPNGSVRSRDDAGPQIECAVTAELNDTSAMPYNAGTTVFDERHSVYKAASDWSDVLQELNILKQVWGHSQEDPADQDVPQTLSNTADGSSFLSGPAKKVEISILLASLPPKSEVDKLIHHFFDRKNFAIPVAPILHEPTFMREYTEHWKDPFQTNVMWLGLLFSVLGITMLSYRQSANEPPEYEGITGTLYELYRLRTAQCLMTGDIAKCLPYTIETLLFNSTAELGREDGNGRGLWMMTGVIVRTAINMGYHRDPSQTSSISILHGELRRRVWLAIAGKDDLASFLVGFPSMMPAIYSDTQEPRNIHDWELSENTTILPPSRPLAESTPVTYLIVKNRLMRVLGRVTDFNNSLRPGSYDKVLEIDNSLDEVFQIIPQHMTLRGGNRESESPQSESATAVSMRQIEFLYHRGMCALHRKFLARSRIDPIYSLSRDRCITAALAVIEQQDALHQKTCSKPSGYMSAWYKLAPARQFFILAAMILCLELEHRRKVPNVDVNDSVLLGATKKACEIWKDIQSFSDEARRVYYILTGLLSSFGIVPEIGPREIQEPVAFEPSEMDQPYKPTNGTLSIDGDASEKSSEMDIDWATWDSFIEGTSFEDAFMGIPFNDDDANSTAR